MLVMQENTPDIDRRTEIQIGDLTLNRANRSARLGADRVTFTAGEFNLLWQLASRAGKIVTRDQLYQELLGIEYDGVNRCVDLRISRLRKKLREQGRPRLIKSIRSEGYLLTVNLNTTVESEQ